MNDYEILYMVSDHEEVNFDILLHKYQPLIYKIVKEYERFFKKLGYEFFVSQETLYFRKKRLKTDPIMTISHKDLIIDLEANFKFKVPISASIGGIKIDDGNNHDLESHILILNGNTITPKGNDMYLLFNSRTNLIEGLNADGARTMNLYNEYISSGHWFKIPLNDEEKTWYFVPINYSGDTPVLEYDYLYF